MHLCHAMHMSSRMIRPIGNAEPMSFAGWPSMPLTAGSSVSVMPGATALTPSLRPVIQPKDLPFRITLGRSTRREHPTAPV